MAERYATKAGLASDDTVWDGGTQPAASDAVYANTYTVTIDQDVTWDLHTDAGATAAAGGTFNTSGSRTITGDTYAGTSHCLTLNAGSIQNGDAIGGATGYLDATTVNAGAILNGNATGGTGDSAMGASVKAGGVQNGNSTGASSGSYSYGCELYGTQNGNSTGTVAYNVGTYAYAGAVQNGDSTGGSANLGYGTTVSSGAIQNGAATGGSASGAHGTYCEQYARVKCTTATGTVAGAFGVLATFGTNYSIVVIDAESGSYPKSLDATVDTTTDNMPLFAAAAGGAIVNQGLHSIGSGINA